MPSSGYCCRENITSSESRNCLRNRVGVLALVTCDVVESLNTRESAAENRDYKSRSTIYPKALAVERTFCA